MCQYAISLYFYRVIIFYILPHHIKVIGVDLYQWALPVIVSVCYKLIFYYRVIIFYILPHHVEGIGVDLYQWALPVIVSVCYKLIFLQGHNILHTSSPYNGDWCGLIPVGSSCDCVSML